MTQNGSVCPLCFYRLDYWYIPSAHSMTEPGIAPKTTPIRAVIFDMAEETLFRGFFFEGILHSKSGARGALIITAGTWASIHVQYDWYGRATIFVFGLFLGYVRLKTGSILVTMCLHSLMNLIATLELIVLLKLKSPNP
jgi:membrane protease YdiL (CAAX protease family)